MEKEETVVDFIKQEFIEKMSNENYDKSFDKIIEEANKIFEQQIMDAFEIGVLVGKAAAARVFEPDNEVVMLYPEITSEEYYNKTFKLK